MRVQQRKKVLALVTFLPFVDTTFNCISTVLPKHNMKMVDLLSRKLSSFFQPIQDDLPLKMPVVYSIPCECGKVYNTQTGHLTETRIKEHY
jgi:hypothetical protein